MYLRLIEQLNLARINNSKVISLKINVTVLQLLFIFFRLGVIKDCVIDFNYKKFKISFFKRFFNYFKRCKIGYNKYFINVQIFLNLTLKNLRIYLKLFKDKNYRQGYLTLKQLRQKQVTNKVIILKTKKGFLTHSEAIRQKIGGLLFLQVKY